MLPSGLSHGPGTPLSFRWGCPGGEGLTRLPAAAPAPEQVLVLCPRPAPQRAGNRRASEPNAFGQGDAHPSRLLPRALPRAAQPARAAGPASGARAAALSWGCSPRPRQGKGVPVLKGGPLLSCHSVLALMPSFSREICHQQQLHLI